MAQPTLQLLAEKVLRAKGPDYFMAYQALRWYMRELNYGEFEAEIEKVDNPDIFRILWAEGLNSYRQAVVVKKWRELEE